MFGIIFTFTSERAAQAQDQASVEALARWIAAVREHQAGVPDAAAGSIAAMKYSDRLRLNPAMEPFIVALGGTPIGTRERWRPIDALFQTVRAEIGVAAFIRRAAMLHADAVIFADRFPALVDDAPAPGHETTPQQFRSSGYGTGTPLHVEIPALLTNEAFVLHADGRIVGDSRAQWEWPFARALLHYLLRAGGDPDKAFVTEWYHAVSSYLFATERHGDLKSHLEAAARALPDEPRLLFDRACYDETLGLPLYRALSEDSMSRDRFAKAKLDVPLEGRTDAEAEALFRRAANADPRLAEARVRLARLLARRGMTEEAASELEKALATHPDPAVAFLAHLVAGRVAQARGRVTESFDHYLAASKLYPDAQSALLGASQAAVMLPNVPDAVAFVQRLSERSASFDADPWRLYSRGPGRDAEELIRALWRHSAAVTNG